MKDLKIVFMGTPEFAVQSLDILVKNNFNVVGVVTAPDKPAGRGQQLSQSAVKKFALEHQLTIMQPEKLKDENFLNQLRSLNADIQIVVAFRMLPEVVWNMPPLGSFNLHASLLPQYRGAAPINWAVINGEKETGVTTFFLQHEIDTGKIIFSEKMPIRENDTAGTVHDKLMVLGSNLVLKTIRAIEKGEYPQTEQQQLSASALKHAPKIFKEDCKIDWNDTCDTIYNKVRGLSPYPTAHTLLRQEGKDPVSIKVFSCTGEIGTQTLLPGNIISDGATYIKVCAQNGFILLNEIQLAGKRKMSVNEFLRGFRFGEKDIFE